MTRAELRRILGVFLVDEWLKEVGWTDADLDRFVTDGIPADWAEMIAKTIPAWPVSIWPKLLHAPRVLTKPAKLSRLDSTKMDIDHRIAISKGKASSSVDAEFKAAYRARNYTLTTLAAAVGVDAALMSKYRRKLRRIPQERADKIATLISWKADLKHWPGGIVPKD